jgi:hypothetical protein
MFAPLVAMPPPMHPAPNFNYNQAVLRTNPFGLPRIMPKQTPACVYYQMPAPYNCYTQLKALPDTREDGDKKQAKAIASVRCKSFKRK